MSENTPSLGPDERAELEAARKVAALCKDECGAIAGASPLDRVNRIHYIADGLDALMHVVDSALHAPPGERPTALGLTPVLYLASMLARDVQHEVSALWDARTQEARP